MTKNELKARQAFAPIKNKNLQERLINRAKQHIRTQLDNVVFIIEGGVR